MAGECRCRARCAGGGPAALCGASFPPDPARHVLVQLSDGDSDDTAHRQRLLIVRVGDERHQLREQPLVLAAELDGYKGGIFIGHRTSFIAPL